MRIYFVVSKMEVSMLYFVKCKECGEESEIRLHEDGPTYCPECQSIDSVEFLEEDE